MGTVLGNRWVRGIAALALLLALYAWLGFRVAPGVLRQQAIELVRERGEAAFSALISTALKMFLIAPM